ncbi:Piso0_003456 [Millerozyma farinosa CBS 7064]|uniref:dynamin GTPase n=1 Tax=Pichia sorbitophila (strain ATCC MYA-4447 / BCRC 22081 / CBS 7064 / NBRC 10061 / NRRL Y-12695) TaxID=559304 RepID=G8YJ45_PICSO|nr:Piso0_003456 [Millerozyma farinosa CBS 7064]CCE81105.1 Piso0_003456 [Millerozyma farinosa CBS 7064]
MSLQDLIPVVNKLQDIVTTTQLADLDLPILAVVGSQSCGKSSVLENIVGKDFLPRGTGIVTRRPLVLQLINIKDDDSLIDDSFSGSYTSSEDEVNLEEYLRQRNGGGKKQNTEWGEFLHLPQKRFYDFHDIRGEIERETTRVAGENKGISRNPIHLKIYSTKVLNLTLVDLPGLTKIPIGDQPSDIEKQTRSLILEYISKPDTIILSVSPANVDLVNSESLKLARSVDPTGKRTIGVLSKLDLMDQGTNALDILKGNVYPLRLGFVGIVNRSQQDIAENKSLDDSLESERQFFQNHPAYRSIASKCGTRYLTQTLNKILMNHIRDRLPDIKARLNTLVGQTEQELASYGELPSNLSESKEVRGAFVLNLMTKFANSFINSIEGTSVTDISTKELCGGARIYYIYNEIFGSSLASISPTQDLSVHDIHTAIRNSTGPRPSLFVPELAFDLLVKPQIKLLQEPSHRCVEMVYEELMKLIHNVCSTGIGLELNRYPKLQSKIIEVVSDLLRERLGPTIKYVESLIEIHTAYINTNHPNFVGAAKAMSSVVDERKIKQEKIQKENMRASSEKILNGSKFESPEESDNTDLSNEEKDIDDINQIDEDIRPTKHKRTSSNKGYYSEEFTSNMPNGAAGQQYYHESFLNYFFGKDSIKHPHSYQGQGQASPAAFKLPPHSESPLPFNSNLLNNGHLNGIHQIHDSSSSVNSKTPQVDPPVDLKPLSLKDIDVESEGVQLGEKQQLECELIRRLIISYFSIIREMIQDQVPKSIMCLLVNYIKQHIQNRLVVKLYNENLFDELLQEDESIQSERERCIELLKTYREASRIISDVV